jgi:hypothetical protein
VEVQVGGCQAYPSVCTRPIVAGHCVVFLFTGVARQLITEMEDKFISRLDPRGERLESVVAHIAEPHAPQHVGGD